MIQKQSLRISAAIKDHHLASASRRLLIQAPMKHARGDQES